MVQAGPHGSDLGRLDLVLDKDRITDYRRTLIPFDHGGSRRNPGTERLIRELLEPHQQALQEPVGVAGDWLVRAQTLAGQEARMRNQESPVDSLFADILREETGADVTLLPGIGTAWPSLPGQSRQLNCGSLFRTMEPSSRCHLPCADSRRWSSRSKRLLGGCGDKSWWDDSGRWHPLPLRSRSFSWVASRGVSRSLRRLGPRPSVPGCHEFSTRKGEHNYREFLRAETSGKGKLSTRRSNAGSRSIRQS